MRIVFAAGGTGGHINPALSVAGEIKKRDKNSEILFIGTQDKMEAKLVPAAGFQLKTIKISGFQRKPSFENLKKNLVTLVRMFTSVSEVKSILKEFKPDAVIGFGGYVSGPVVRTAAKMGIKTAIHEQNAFPGMTNKALTKLADVTMLTVEAAKDRMSPKNEPIVTGLPIREEILNADKSFARAELGIAKDEILIFSTGGSLGAKTVNTVMTELMAAISDKNIRFIHGYGQYGRWVPDRLAELGVDISDTKKYDLREYIYNMATCLAAADIVVSRAGASSISELQALGKTAILIPSPNVAENHQYHNAMDLVNNNAAILLEEKQLSGSLLTETVRELLADPIRLSEIGNNAKKMAHTDAKDKICDIIQELVSH